MHVELMHFSYIYWEVTYKATMIYITWISLNFRLPSSNEYRHIYIYIYISVVSFQSKIKKIYTCCRKFRKLLAFFSENKKAPKIVRTEASLLSFCHSPYEGHKHHGVIEAP